MQKEIFILPAEVTEKTCYFQQPVCDHRTVCLPLFHLLLVPPRDNMCHPTGYQSVPKSYTLWGLNYFHTEIPGKTERLYTYTQSTTPHFVLSFVLHKVSTGLNNTSLMIKTYTHLAVTYNRDITYCIDCMKNK